MSDRRLSFKNGSFGHLSSSPWRLGIVAMIALLAGLFFFAFRGGRRFTEGENLTCAGAVLMLGAITVIALFNNILIFPGVVFATAVVAAISMVSGDFEKEMEEV